MMELYIFKLRTACPDLDLEELNEQFEKRRGATQLEYRCDYWCAQLATHTGRSKLDVFNEVKACLETPIGCKAAPLPRGRKRWEQKLAEWEALARQ